MFQIEILVYCPLTTRQRLLYQGVKNKISIEDLISSTSHASQAQSTTSSLMNLVMQFRKVGICLIVVLYLNQDFVIIYPHATVSTSEGGIHVIKT